MGRRQRILRALARGGHAARRNEAVWDVWPGGDRRQRPIGELPCEDVSAYIATGEMSYCGEPGLAVWTGAMPVLEASPSAPMPSEMSGCYFQRLVLGIADFRTRDRLSGAARRFREDGAALTSGDIASMNWSAIRAGTRLDGGPGREAPFNPQRMATGRRLQAVGAALSLRQQHLLEALVLFQDSRARLSRALNLPERATEAACIEALRALADAYDGKGAEGEIRRRERRLPA